MKRDHYEADLLTPIESLRGWFFKVRSRPSFANEDDAKLERRTGKTFEEFGSTSPPAPYNHEVGALVVEAACRRVAQNAGDKLDRYEAAMHRLIGKDVRLQNAISIFANIAFNCGFEAGNSDRHSVEENVWRTKGAVAMLSNESKRIAATKKRRELGNATRDRARKLMARKPHLSWTACANEIAAAFGRDSRGVARVIEELFPKGSDGKRRYKLDDPQEGPA